MAFIQRDANQNFSQGSKHVKLQESLSLADR
jgi:hypothetical protein